MMAKNYDIDKSRVTGWWVWSCDDGSANGAEPTKRGARQAAAAACSQGYGVAPPPVDAELVGGHVTTFAVANLNGEKVRFTTDDISQDVLSHLSGMDCINPRALKSADIVAGALKIWGVYQGGTTEAAIQKQHGLTRKQFERLAGLRFKGMKLTIEDNGSLVWTS